MANSFISGFVKAARASGLTEEQIDALYKSAVEDPAAAAGAIPVMGGAPASAAATPAPADPHATGAGEEEIEQLLAQLSPEELDQLAAELAQEMGGAHAPGEAGEAGHPGEQGIAELAKAIEQHLASNPEASLGQGEPDGDEAASQDPALAQAFQEKTSSLEFVKSASYIEGFLSNAVEQGYSLKQAVDIYDQALGVTIENLRGDVESTKQASEARDYYEGIFERALEHGLSEKQAAEFVYELMEKESGLVQQARNFVPIAQKALQRGIAAAVKPVTTAPAVEEAVAASRAIGGKHPFRNVASEVAGASKPSSFRGVNPAVLTDLERDMKVKELQDLLGKPGFMEQLGELVKQHTGASAATGLGVAGAGALGGAALSGDGRN